VDYAKALADAIRQYLARNDISEGGKLIYMKMALDKYDAHPAEAATRENGKLLPCPFCAAKPQRPEFYGESKTARFVICSQCGANVYRAWPGEDDAILIAAWNARKVVPTSDVYPPFHLEEVLHEAAIEEPFLHNGKWCISKDGALAGMTAVWQRMAALSTHQQQGAENELVKRLRRLAEEYSDEVNHKTLHEAADVLSRAPQPDTVTEGMVREAAIAIRKTLMAEAPDDGWPSIEEAIDERELTVARAALTAALAARGK